MSLSFTGPGGTVEQRWITYALLCDNIQHYLEGGQPSAEFEAIHAVAQALGGSRVTLNARRLRSELEKAGGLLERPIAELAISQRTRAVIDGSWTPREGPKTTTMLAQGMASIPWLSQEVRTLDDAFGHLVRSLLEVTAGAGEDAVVEVDDS